MASGKALSVERIHAAMVWAEWGGAVESFKSMLQRCRTERDLECGSHVHALICNHGLEGHVALGPHIVAMFAECGSVPRALHTFNRSLHWNQHSWTSLLSAHITLGQPRHALTLYQSRQEQSAHPSRKLLISLLKSCARLRDMETGRGIHDEMAPKGLDTNPFVGSALVDMYLKCGALVEARSAFDKLLARDTVSWTALIAGYTEHGLGEEALECFQQMQSEGISPDAIAYVCALRACGSIKAIERGRELHAQIAENEIESDPIVGNCLVDMYAKCGLLSEARKAFDKLPSPDVVPWTSLITGYIEQGRVHETLECFTQMQSKGISLDSVAFVCFLKACSSIRAIDLGREMHVQITRRGFDKDIFVGSALMNMYVKCGSLSEAHEVFDELSVRNVVSWTTLIAGYAERGSAEEVLKLFQQMQLEGISPDIFTYSCVLKACGAIRAIERGREIHMQIIKKGFDADQFLGNTLVDMYARCGALSEAQEVFNRLSAPTVVAYTALIAGYAEHGPCQEALGYFEQMQHEGISPDAATYVCALKACSSIVAIDKCRAIHMEITQKGIENNPYIGSALVGTYSKCGSLLEAREVFDKLPVRDNVLWSTMINGYGMNNEGNLAVQCFEEMQNHGMEPDAATFTCLLTACCRASLVLKGQHYFKEMKDEYGILPTMDHYTCMIDLLARSGYLYEAEKILKAMPCIPSVEAWTALLCACKSYGEVETGLRCFKQLVCANPENASSYMLMANIYASAGRADDAFRVEGLRKLARAKKTQASSLIEVNKEVYQFVIGDKQSNEISAMLEFLSSQIKEEGHASNLGLVLRSVSDEGKEAALCEHVEKLALAFGLLSTPQGQTLHMSKNMRMCSNCHDTNKSISRIVNREIIIRDSHCVHHFKDGLCSCRTML